MWRKALVKMNHEQKCAVDEKRETHSRLRLNGNCYHDVMVFIIKFPPEDLEDDLEVIHGTTSVNGKTIQHAWVRMHSCVWELHSRKYFDATKFEKNFLIDAEYSGTQAMRNLFQTKQCGPWDD